MKKAYYVKRADNHEYHFYFSESTSMLAMAKEPCLYYGASLQRKCAGQQPPTNLPYS
jgi:hypothetical protein